MKLAWRGAVVAWILTGIPAARAQDPDTLVQAVLVSRHGVRTPTESAAELASLAARPWPAWKEPPGDLTARGRQLATLLGRYYRGALAADGLLPAQGCPARSSVSVYADVFQRTEETAKGLVEGLAPGCRIPVDSRAPAKVDGVFHPVAAGVCRIDGPSARAAVLARVGSSFREFVAARRPAFDTLQSVLECCGSGLCTKFGRPAGCGLPEVPTDVVALPDGRGITLTGGLSLAAMAAEIFLLEYTDGRPSAEVGWGRVGLPDIQKVLPVHDAAFDLLFRTPYIARRQGSSLLARVAGAITGRGFGGLAAPLPAVRDARLVVYVGHDDNIANLGGLLGASWSMPGYPENETPPGGALLFEKRRTADGREQIFLSYVAQTPDQMRDAAPLTLAAPPIRAPIRIPGCSLEERGFPCPLEGFARLVAGALDPDCVDRTSP